VHQSPFTSTLASAGDTPPTTHPMRSTLVGLAAVLLAAASPLSAQLAPVARQQTLTLNPIGLAAGFYSAEYERAVHPHYTISLGGSRFSFGSDYDKVTYTAGDVRLRYYANHALEGFNVGLSAGVIRTGEEYSSYDYYDGSSTSRETRSQNGVTVGSTIEYAWLLGESKSVAFSLGGGFKRILLIDGNSPNFTSFYPTLRTSFGFAF
jgi:uncharacterized protein DUF3575